MFANADEADTGIDGFPPFTVAKYRGVVATSPIAFNPGDVERVRPPEEVPDVAPLLDDQGHSPGNDEDCHAQPTETPPSHTFEQPVAR